MSYQQNGALSA